MTVSKSRAALAALLLAAAPLALTAAQGQERESTQSDGGLTIRRAPANKPAALAMSSSVARQLQASQTALVANKLPDALTAAKAGLDAAKTDYEKGKANQFLLSVYMRIAMPRAWRSIPKTWPRRRSMASS